MRGLPQNPFPETSSSGDMAGLLMDGGAHRTSFDSIMTGRVQVASPLAVAPGQVRLSRNQENSRQYRRGLPMVPVAMKLRKQGSHPVARLPLRAFAGMIVERTPRRLSLVCCGHRRSLGVGTVMQAKNEAWEGS